MKDEKNPCVYWWCGTSLGWVILVIFVEKKTWMTHFFIIIVKELCEEVLRKKFEKMYVKFVE